MAYPAKTERNEALCREFRAGASLAELSDRYGISRERVQYILTRSGALGTPEERRRRRFEHARRIARDPVIRARKSEKMRRLHAAGLIAPKKAIFADDPARRADYIALRNAMGAAYARQAMGVDA